MTNLNIEAIKIRMMLPKLIDLKEGLSPSTVGQIMYDCHELLRKNLDSIPPRMHSTNPQIDSWSDFFHDTNDTYGCWNEGLGFVAENDIHDAHTVGRARSLLEATIEILDERLDEEGIEYGN